MVLMTDKVIPQMENKMEIKQETIDWLKKIANKESGDVEAAGSNGNYDDAYYMGCDDGEISLANQILNQLEN